MDRSHSRSASPRDPARPQHRPPSPPSPPAFENKAYQHDDHDPNHNDSFNSNGHSNGHKEPNGDSKTLEAVNLELINLTPKNGNAKKKDVEVDMSGSNPYDEYFVPVNEHRKYMRGEKLYVTADKRGEKGGCKRPLCWTLLGLVVAAIVALIVLAATGILFANSPTPLEPYNASVSSARALGGITHVTSHDHHDHHGHDHSEDHTHETTTETEYEPSTEHINLDNESSEERGEMIENAEAPPPDSTRPPSPDNNEDRSASNESDNSMLVPRTIEGELKIDNKDFIEHLEDPDSDEYTEFVNSFTEALKPAIISKSPLDSGHNNIKLEIIKIRNESGSIVVTYRIHWEPKYYNQNSDDLLTAPALETILKNYLAKNDRMISTYHIADDKMTTKQVLDICKIEKNGCDYQCQFNNETLDFTCICPRGQIQDMKHPKQCVPLLNPNGTGSSSIVDVFASVTTPVPAPEPKPNTESITTTEKEPVQDTTGWKTSNNHMADTTTEADADVSFSHIFGNAATESEKQDTDIFRDQPESNEEQNGITTNDSHIPGKSLDTTTLSDLLPPTIAPEPIAEPAPEPEPTPGTKSYSEMFERNNFDETNQPDKATEPQPYPEPEPDIVHQIIPIATTTTETHLAPESQTTTEQIIIPVKKDEPQFVYERVITAEEPNNTENLTTTDVSFVTVAHNKYGLKSNYNLEHQVEETTIVPLVAHIDNKFDNTSELHIKFQEKNYDATTIENEWLEDTVRPEIHNSGINDAKESYQMNHVTESDSNQTTEEGRSSKAFGSEFNVDELINELHTTLQYNDKENDETTTMNYDLSLEQMTTTTPVPTTTAVSIAQIFFGKKPVNQTLKSGIPSTTTMSVLSGFEGALQQFNNVSVSMDTHGNMEAKNQVLSFEDVTVSNTTPRDVHMTTTVGNSNQNRGLHLNQNMLTNINNTASVNDTSNSKIEPTGAPEDVTDADITFDAINRLFNRSSKSFPSEPVNPEMVVSEINDIYKEITDTTTASDWLTETVSEMNYQDVINENKNRETTETQVTKLDEIISREMNRDDFEPDYLNMGSKTSKSLEHDEPLYGMLQDYDNDDSISRRVKNEPGKMIDETTKIEANDTIMENTMEEKIATIKPSTQENTIFETTTVNDYVYKLSSTEYNNLITSTSNSATVHSLPQVWEKPEEDLNSNATEPPKDLPNTLLPEPEQNSSSQNIVHVEEPVTQSDNMTQGNNLNVTIYEISNHRVNNSVEKSTNHQSSEYDDHETEMNPFLPEIENNKSLVKKLQEGHDIEPSNVNETQNENLEEQSHHNLDGSATVKNQTGISNNLNVMPSLPIGNDGKTVDRDALSNDLLVNQNTRGSEETSQVSGEFIKGIETTQSPIEQIEDDPKELSDQNFSLPTFLMDTDDLDTTKDPFDNLGEKVDSKINKTELRTRIKDDNNFLSVVPIEQENVEDKQNLKNNYDKENIPELNTISDSPKKSDRRTVESSNVNSLIDNEA